MNKRKCKTKFCRNKIKQRVYCSSCRHKKWRLANPEKYYYLNLKFNAKRRKKPFTISFEYFMKFCHQTMLIAGKGRTKTSLTVDCIKPWLGYIEGNLQALTLEANASKGKKYLSYDWATNYAIYY